MIKETVKYYRFEEVLRFDEYASWSRGAIQALYDYYEQLSEDLGNDIELDPVAIRCEWSEYPSAYQCAIEHGYNVDTLEDDEPETKARKWLEERATVLDVENVDTSANEYRVIKSILVMQF